MGLGVGQVVDHYRLDGVIARGGAMVVYSAVPGADRLGARRRAPSRRGPSRRAPGEHQIRTSDDPPGAYLVDLGITTRLDREPGAAASSGPATWQQERRSAPSPPPTAAPTSPRWPPRSSC